MKNLLAQMWLYVIGLVIAWVSIKVVAEWARALRNHNPVAQAGTLFVGLIIAALITFWALNEVCE